MTSTTCNAMAIVRPTSNHRRSLLSVSAVFSVRISHAFYICKIDNSILRYFSKVQSLSVFVCSTTSAASLQSSVNYSRSFVAFKRSLLAASRSLQRDFNLSSRVHSASCCNLSNSFTFVLNSSASLRTTQSSSFNL